MPEFSFEVEKPNGSKTEYLTRGNALTAEEAVERVYERYPEGEIVRQLYGGDVSDVDLSNPDASSTTGVTTEATEDEDVDDELIPEEVVEEAVAEAEAAEAEADEGADEPADEAMVPPPIDPAAFTVSEMRSELSEREMSDAQLRGLKTSEEGGENRVTIIRAINERIADE